MTHTNIKPLRFIYRSIRQNLPIHFQKTRSSTINHSICQMDSFQQAKHIALYFAVNGEVSLNTVFQYAQKLKIRCYFPILNDNFTLSFLPADKDTPLKNNRFGIAEPCVERSLAIEPNRLDLILLPLVAFDEHGTRLGMGGGYYDRTLENAKKPILLGVAYDFQKQSFIEPQPWDIPLHATITERKTYWSKT